MDFNNFSSLLSTLTKKLSSAWDDLATILVNENDRTVETQLTSSLEDIGHRVVVLRTILARLTNRFKGVALFLGYTKMDAKDVDMQGMCKMISEFSMDYRVVYKKKQEQMKKKAQDAKRRKTRGVMVGKVSALVIVRYLHASENQVFQQDHCISNVQYVYIDIQ